MAQQRADHCGEKIIATLEEKTWDGGCGDLSAPLDPFGGVQRPMTYYRNCYQLKVELRYFMVVA